ncbi:MULTISPECIES: STAS domain-containing protein [Herpetosiphon]|uniref:Anti-sigma factor antagonist n=1 Tax=Herpetosiphon geysericola TaxID=70996 RepID=A0A0P6Y5W5_9CHLR|nr:MULTISPECIES: STAS domain-containing protein [Herpetosiphon]KPL88104.1 anti-sigma factor antagonist [Herpetosiphon geysericola]MBM7844828.1 anti-anti-sigma factor [Herpetosiphon giganteus]
MIDDELKVTTRQRDGIWIIDLEGDVTTFAEEAITGAYEGVSKDGAKYIIINSRQSDYINSAGIAILIGVVTEVNRQAQKLAISGLSPHFQKIFRMVGLAQYADIFATEEEAIAAMQRHQKAASEPTKQ